MIRFAAAAVFVAAGLAACAPKETDKAATETAAAQAAEPAAPTSAFAPSETMKQTFVDCTWGDYAFGGVAISGYDCPKSKVVVDAALPGLILEAPPMEGSPGGRHTSLQVFTKGIDASIEDVLTAVRAASPGPFVDGCVFQPAGNDDKGATFTLVPTGAGKQASDDFQNGKPNSDAGVEPCGPMGPTEAGERVFVTFKEAPGLVVFASISSDIWQLDYKTLRVAK